ncbi:MAG: type II toxin-antitoxin system RelE/ParE family toxin [Chloroflexi bacterium]|nr:type II toxin-antitoxin system RelE/ParE family toxin [Chloroflexota bacterium]
MFDAVTAYAASGQGDVVKLSGSNGVYRLRVGDWRVLFSFEAGGFVVLALRVLNRRDAYR